jgi:hypothetical protein
VWIMHDDLAEVVRLLQSEPREPPLPVSLFWALDDADKLLDEIAAMVPAPKKSYLRLYIVGGPDKTLSLVQRWLERLDGAMSLPLQSDRHGQTMRRKEAVRAIVEARPILAVHYVPLPLDEAMPSIVITALQCQSIAQRASAILMQ